jgi:glycosyltransferase involved in cell wall biosynthesis
MVGVSMPSRTYNILAVGKPILALTEDGSELARVIEEENVGWIVPPHDPESLIATVTEIRDNRHLLIEKSQAARAVAVGKYSLETALERYREEL